MQETFPSGFFGEVTREPTSGSVFPELLEKRLHQTFDRVRGGAIARMAGRKKSGPRRSLQNALFGGYHLGGVAGIVGRRGENQTTYSVLHVELELEFKRDLLRRADDQEEIGHLFRIGQSRPHPVPLEKGIKRLAGPVNQLAIKPSLHRAGDPAAVFEQRRQGFADGRFDPMREDHAPAAGFELLRVDVRRPKTKLLRKGTDHSGVPAQVFDPLPGKTGLAGGRHPPPPLRQAAPEFEQLARSRRRPQVGTGSKVDTVEKKQIRIVGVHSPGGTGHAGRFSAATKKAGHAARHLQPGLGSAQKLKPSWTI